MMFQRNYETTNKLKVFLKAKDPSLSWVDTRQFEQLFQVKHLDKLQFANWQVEKYIKKQCKKALEKGRIDRLALWLGKFHREALENPSIPDVTLRWINDKVGYGIFANKRFEAWEAVGEYTGLLRRRNLFFPNINDFCFMYPREWISFKAFTIDSRHHGNFTRFINHSDTPNCESVSVYFDGVFRILFRTIAPIEPDEELTYDYGELYWYRRMKLTW